MDRDNNKYSGSIRRVVYRFGPFFSGGRRAFTADVRVAHILTNRTKEPRITIPHIVKMEEAAPAGYKLVREGKAKILYQIPPGEEGEGVPPVFYNPVQEFNRDISILALNVFSKERPSGEGFQVLEALAATGLRSIRFLQEVPRISRITINDLDPQAIAAAQKNLAFNHIDMSKVQRKSLAMSCSRDPGCQLADAKIGGRQDQLRRD